MTLSILIILILSLYLFFALKNFNFALYFIFILLPTYRVQFGILGFPMNLLSAFIWIIVFVWFIRNFRNIALSLKGLFSRPKETIMGQNIFGNFKWPIILILISAFISVLVSYDTTKALGLFKSYFLESLFLFVVVVSAIKDKKQFKKIVYSLGVLGILIFILSLYQKLTGNFTFSTTGIIEDNRVISFFGYPNANGLILVPIFFLNLLNLLQDKKLYLKVFNVLVFLTAFITVFWSKSESAIIAMISGLLIFACFKLINNKKFFYFVSFSIILVSLLFPYVIKSPQTVDVPGSKNYSIKEKLLLQDLSGQIRRNMYDETKQLLKEKSFFASGLNGFQNDSIKYHKYDYIEIFLYPHSIFMNFYVSLGLFGMLGFLWLTVNLIRFTITKYFSGSRDQIFILLTMLAIIIQGIVEAPYFKNDLSIVWWTVFVGAIVLGREDNVARENK